MKKSRFLYQDPVQFSSPPSKNVFTHINPIFKSNQYDILKSMERELDKEQHWYDSIDLDKICSKYRISIWQCPQFLFLVMGAFIITSILVTYQVTRSYQDPEIAALIVLILSAVLFAIGNIIVNSFERVALSLLSKSEFISIMSHQLRSPLSAIKWQLNVLSTDNFSDYIKGIYEQNERMIHSVNDLLEVNRIDDNDIVLKPVEFSLAELTEKVVNNFQKLSEKNNAKISLLIEPDLPLAYADEERIMDVLEHLIDNAIRYSLGGGEITIGLKRNDKGVLWRIVDQGSGIPKEDQKKVFEKFFRSDNITRYQTIGSGVGLFIAKSIIKLSGGEMGFSSTLNKGSIFWFLLPIKK